MDSLLAHLTDRFVTQAENLATEALCYLLRSRPAAGGAMVELVQAFGVDISEAIVFQTQEHAVDDAAIPDLVGVASGGATPLVCEVKFWAGLTAHQPLSYLRRLPAGEAGLLLFIAPVRREAYIKAELSRRLSDAGVVFAEADRPAPGPALSIGDHTLGILAWRTLLSAIELRLEQEGDRAGLSDLRQLQGLADRMDEDAFLPLESEELSGNKGRRIIQLASLLDDVVTELAAAGLVSTKGLRAAATARWVGRWMRLAGAEALLRIDFERWGTLAATPVWLRVSGGPGSATAGALAPLRHAHPPRLFEWPSASQIPLYLPVGADREGALAALETQLREVHDLLAAAGPFEADSVGAPGAADPTSDVAKAEEPTDLGETVGDG